MVDGQGFYYPKNHYKKNMYVAMLDRSHNESVRFELRGAFPIRKPFVDLSYGDDDVLKYVVEFSVDRVDMTSLIGFIRSIIRPDADMASKTIELLGGAGGTIKGALTSSGNVLSRGGANL